MFPRYRPSCCRSCLHCNYIHWSPAFVLFFGPSVKRRSHSCLILWLADSVFPYPIRSNLVRCHDCSRWCQTLWAFDHWSSPTWRTRGREMTGKVSWYSILLSFGHFPSVTCPYTDFPCSEKRELTATFTSIRWRKSISVSPIYASKFESDIT